jgi:hypothetical protein
LSGVMPNQKPPLVPVRFILFRLATFLYCVIVYSDTKYGTFPPVTLEIDIAPVS